MTRTYWVRSKKTPFILRMLQTERWRNRLSTTSLTFTRHRSTCSRRQASRTCESYMTAYLAILLPRLATSWECRCKRRKPSGFTCRNSSTTKGGWFNTTHTMWTKPVRKSQIQKDGAFVESHRDAAREACWKGREWDSWARQSSPFIFWFALATSWLFCRTVSQAPLRYICSRVGGIQDPLTLCHLWHRSEKVTDVEENGPTYSQHCRVRKRFPCSSLQKVLEDMLAKQISRRSKS